MKRGIRIAVLIAGALFTYFAATVPSIPVADGGPIITCDTHGHCIPVQHS